MPIYEYRCDKCEHEFEAEQRITEEPLRVCPKCRARKLRRLISQTSFVLKGGGWYSDLYSSSKGKSDAQGGESAASKSESAASESTASKSESAGTGTPPTDSGSKKGAGKKKSESKKAAA
jgi:putative FmdB family regulatory protein